MIDLCRRPPSLTAALSLYSNKIRCRGRRRCYVEGKNMVERMLFFIVPRSYIQKSYLVIMVTPGCPSAGGLILRREGVIQRCRKHGIDSKSITPPPSVPRLPHLSTPSNVWSTSSRRLFVLPIGSQTVFGTCNPFGMQ